MKTILFFDQNRYNPLLDSSDMGPEDWAKLADDIDKNYLDYEGFVILMGTDTMVCLQKKITSPYSTNRR